MSQLVDDANRKDQIAASALEVFADHGYSETTVRQIADRADISKGTIYLYYDSKTDILVEVFHTVEQTLHEVLDRVLAGSGRPEDKLDTLMTELINLLKNNRATFKVLFDFWSHSLHHPDDNEINFESFYGRLRGKLEVLLEEGMSRGVFRTDLDDDLALILIGFLEGQIVQWLINPASTSLDNVKKTGLTLLIEGLGDT